MTFFSREALRATTVIFGHRAGDSKLKGFVGMTKILNTTSVGVLQEQCVRRNLKVRTGGALRDFVETHATLRYGTIPGGLV